MVAKIVLMSLMTKIMSSSAIATFNLKLIFFIV